MLQQKPAEELSPVETEREKLYHEWRSFETHPFWKRMRERLHWLSVAYADAALAAASRGEGAAAVGPAFAAREVKQTILTLPEDLYRRLDAILVEETMADDGRRERDKAMAAGPEDSYLGSGTPF